MDMPHGVNSFFGTSVEVRQRTCVVIPNNLLAGGNLVVGKGFVGRGVPMLVEEAYMSLGRVGVLVVSALLLAPTGARAAGPSACALAVDLAQSKYLNAKYRYVAACERKRSSGVLLPTVNCRPANGAVTDAGTASKLATATGKVAPAITAACPTLPPIGPACDSAATTAQLAACITASTQDADVEPINVDTLIETVFDANAPVTNPGLQVCQSTISKKVGQYLKKRIRLHRQCRIRQTKGTNPGPCPDAKMNTLLFKARLKLDTGIRPLCTEAQLASNVAPQLLFGLPCEQYKNVTFKRSGVTNTNSIAVQDRFIPCIADATASVADRMEDIPFPGAEPSAFTQGVAAGDATDTAAIFWTRLPDSTMGAFLDLALNGAFSVGLVTVNVPAPGVGDDGTVKVDRTGLLPATDYSYRFRQGTDTSPTGRVHTAPAPGDATTPLRLGWSGDANAFFRPFSVLDQLRLLDVQGWFFIGDTIYGDDPRSSGLVAQTVDDYYSKYRENRADAGLREAMASMGTYSMWDDHESRNDVSGAVPVYASRLTNGNLAFRRYNPMRDDTGDAMRLYRSFRWGDLAEFFIIDGRQYRSAKYTCCNNVVEDGYVITDTDTTCTTSGELLLPFGLSPSCAAPANACQVALCDPSRTVLGTAQKAWLKSGLLASTAKFKFVMNGTPITNLLFQPSDRWEAYAAERDEILTHIDANSIKNVLWLSTDLHGIVLSPNGVNVAPAAGPNPHPTPEIVAGAIGMDPIFRELPPTILPILPSLPAFLTHITEYDIDRFNVVLLEVTPGVPQPTAKFNFIDRTGAVIHTLSFTAVP